MTLKASLYAALAALGLAAVPAQADPVRLAQYAPGDEVRPYEVVSIVRSMALQPISRPMRYGHDYILRAIDLRRGYEVRVVVDARIGEVVSVLPVVRYARPVEFDPPPWDWRRRRARWRDDYPPEWGERSAPRTALRSNPRIERQRQSGPSVIYAPRELMRGAPRASRSPAQPIEHPPLPRSRPDDMASPGATAPSEIEPATRSAARAQDEATVVTPEVAASAPPPAAPEVSVKPQTPAEPEVATAKPKVPAVTPPF